MKIKLRTSSKLKLKFPKLKKLLDWDNKLKIYLSCYYLLLKKKNK